jgi:hypothetical protein
MNKTEAEALVRQQFADIGRVGIGSEFEDVRKTIVVQIAQCITAISRIKPVCQLCGIWHTIVIKVIRKRRIVATHDNSRDGCALSALSGGTICAPPDIELGYMKEIIPSPIRA